MGELSASRSDAFLRLDLVDSAGRPVAERSFHWLSTLGDANLPTTNVKIEAAKCRGNHAEVTISSDMTSVFTLLETSGGPAWAGKFSENAMTLLPGESKTVTFTAKNIEQLTEKDLMSKLQVRSLSDAFVRDEMVAFA